MSITATYASSTSFTVATDRTSDFSPGMAVRLDCGVDGVKYGFVSYSSYSAPDTTVNLDSTESQAITNNLASVDFSRVKSKEAGGNLPLQVIWMNRGFKGGLTLSYKDADEIYIDSGALHIDNGSAENVFCAQSKLTKQLTSLSASTWYAIYVDPPDNGLSLVADDIEYASTMPTYDQAKRGWYHPTNTDWRCIGFIYSNASSQVTGFTIASQLYRLSASITAQTWADGNVNTSLDITLTIPLANMVAYVFYEAARYSTTAGYVYLNIKGGTATGIGYIDSLCNKIYSYMLINCDSAKKITASGSVRYGIGIYVVGFMMPDGM